MTTFDVQFGQRPIAPPNIDRRPIPEPPMVPIHESAIGSQPVTDEPAEFDFWATVEAELEVDSQPYVKSESPA